jgi:hypothetical protein
VHSLLGGTFCQTKTVLVAVAEAAGANTGDVASSCIDFDGEMDPYL